MDLFTAKLILSQILCDIFHTRKIDRTLIEPYAGDLGRAIDFNEGALQELVAWIENAFPGHLKAGVVLDKRRILLSIERA